MLIPANKRGGVYRNEQAAVLDLGHASFVSFSAIQGRCHAGSNACRLLHKAYDVSNR